MTNFHIKFTPFSWQVTSGYAISISTGKDSVNQDKRKKEAFLNKTPEKESARAHSTGCLLTIFPMQLSRVTLRTRVAFHFGFHLFLSQI
jgi:hypothetical protein